MFGDVLLHSTKTLPDICSLIYYHCEVGIITDSKNLKNSSKTALHTQDQLGLSSNPLNRSNLPKNSQAPLGLRLPLFPESLHRKHLRVSRLLLITLSVLPVCLSLCRQNQKAHRCASCGPPPFRTACAAPDQVPSPGKAAGLVTSSVGIFSCWETSQDGSVDPGRRPGLRGGATGGFLTARSSCFTHSLCELPLRNRDV